MRFPSLRPALAVVALALLGLATLPARAQIVDQQQTISVGFGAGIRVPSQKTLGQEFVPTLSALNFVDLLIEDFVDGTGATLGVNIRDDVITGALLGTSAPLILPDGFGNTGGPPGTGGAEARFLFATPVALTPGNRYVIEITPFDGDFRNPISALGAGPFINPNRYAAGRAIFPEEFSDIDPEFLADFFFREGLLALGATQSIPLPPTTTRPGRFDFTNVLSGLWFDPPLVSGYTYTMTGGSLFSSILDFPTGFASPFTVDVGGTILGSFGPGQSVDFSGFAGGGVSSFSVTGITPLVDAANPLAFPLQIAFTTPTASFTMQAINPLQTEIPEPGTLALLFAGGMTTGVGFLRRRA